MLQQAATGSASTTYRPEPNSVPAHQPESGRVKLPVPGRNLAARAGLPLLVVVVGLVVVGGLWGMQRRSERAALQRATQGIAGSLEPGAGAEAAPAEVHPAGGGLILFLGALLAVSLGVSAYLAGQNRAGARAARAAQAQAGSSDQRNQAILEAVPDLMLRVARDGTVRALKPAKGFLGRSDVIGQKLHEVFPVDFARQALLVLEQVLATGQTRTAEYEIRVDGEIRHREARLAVYGTDEVLIIVRDVTEQKRAEVGAQEVRTILQAILDNSPSLIYVKDREGRYLTANRALELLLGRGSKEILGRTDHDLFPKEVADSLLLNDRRVLDAGRALESEEAPVWGSPRTYISVKFPLRDPRGRPSGVCTIATDITERKAAERALRESEERYRSLFAHNLAGVYRSTATGRILECNQAFAEIYGYSGPEAIKRRGALALYLAPGDREDFLARLRAEGEICGLESQAVRDDGTPIWILENVRLVPGDEGEVLEGTLVDITERKRLEDQLAHAQRMDALGRLAGGVAHDFNNLLTAILGFAGLLQRRLGCEQDSKSARDLGEIQKAAHRASELTQKLLAFSRKQTLSPQVLDLNHAILDVENLLRRLLGEQVELTTALAAGPHPVKADPGQLEQVIVNLAVNARDALPQGGTIRIATGSLVLDAAEARERPPLGPGAYQTLAISDDGVGMDPATLSHIFEPFYTTKPKNKGTGLGLATVYGIVSQSGGHITVHSRPGLGTTFVVYLPHVTDVPPVSPRPVEEAFSAQGTETILVVEDEEAVRDLVTSCLETGGYSVLRAESAAQALDLIESHPEPIHLLLTDVVMPKISGPELARTLTESHPDLRVLYMSGYAPTSLWRDGGPHRDRSLLQKPFTPAELAKKVREALAGSTQGG